MLQQIPISAEEAVAFLLSVAYVFLNAKQNPWCWPVGGASVAIYAVVFFNSNLLADAALQVIYIGLSLYGWYSWKFSSPQSVLPITSVYNKANQYGTLYIRYTALLFAATYMLLRTFAMADYRVLDALCFALSILATYLSAKKVIENWPVWIVTNGLYILLYSLKGLYLTALLSVIMGVMAYWGWQQWKKELKA